MKKSFILTVSPFPGCYRHIQIDEKNTLHDLHDAIMDAFDFDDDHLHIFFMDNKPWSYHNQYICPRVDDLDSAKAFTNEVKLSQFHLEKGDKFLYIFDFGDEWRFQIKVLREVEEETKLAYVKKSVGKVSQYGEIEDEDDWE
ncbi:MAG: plasmid pRiA4b ORF-3 family protein [Turicibacter sp.]|nr:plasmid pRiA4b ORF-3 family protein [Turicibacter sp.]